MARTFKLGQVTSGKTKQLIGFFVSDAHDNTDIDTRPKAVEFTISDLYDEDTQRARAEAYCDYLNKLEEAKKVAYDQIHLMDVLSRP